MKDSRDSSSSEEFSALTQNENRRSRLERPELYSFILVITAMGFYGILFLPGFSLLFAVLAVLDGCLTIYRMDALISIERAFFGFLSILLTAVVANFGILPIMVEGALVLSLLDFSSLLRNLRYSDEIVKIAGSRLRSYLSSLVPALGLSFGTVFLYSSLASVPKEPILPLALASAGTLVIVLVVARFMNSRK